MSMERREPRLILGRNYIETLILTMTQFELVAGSEKLEEFVVRRLEQELCARALVIQAIGNEYRKSLVKLLKMHYPDIPEPPLQGCFLIDQLYDYIIKNPHAFFGDVSATRRTDVERAARRISIKFARSAIMAALFSAGMV